MIQQVKGTLSQVWPKFHRHRHNAHLHPFHTFNDYWRLWTISICILVGTALIPLFIVTLIHYQLIQKSVDNELELRAERLTATTKSAVSFFMQERLDALMFTVREAGYRRLSSHRQLNEILMNMKLGFGGLLDLSVIDADGDQIAYAGPYNLEGKNYANQPWFSESLKKRYFVSEVFTGYREVPHIIIAVSSKKEDGTGFILRATLDTERLIQKLASYKTGGHADIFLVNREGVLQTPSVRFGPIFSKTGLDVASVDQHVIVEFNATPDGRADILFGRTAISTNLTDTPFVLVVQKEKQRMMHIWLKLRRSINWTVGVCVFLIVVVVTMASTLMANKLYELDNAKAATMLQMEQSQQLASIGQLAAGVAHEINNPLAVISETAGYIKDLFEYTDGPADRDEVVDNIDEILAAVSRCGTITKQLLGFVRRFDIRIRKIYLEKMVDDVLSFHKKEAEYKRIAVTVSMPDDLPPMETDSGKLQQVLVNLINNAFQAVDEDGCLTIRASMPEKEQVEVVIEDTGCGIPEENLERIQEPFFSTKQEKSGTGLGLSITYSLVKKLGGKIFVQSTEGVGTSFTIRLPMKLNQRGAA